MGKRQLELFPDDNSKDLADCDSSRLQEIAEYLSSRCRRPVRIVFTDNTSTMISVDRSPSCRVRLHHMFAGAPEPVLNALAVYLKWPRHKASNAVLSEYITRNTHVVKKRSARKRRLRTRGEFFDLKDIRERLNLEYFNGAVKAPITWGRPYRGKRRRSIRFGCVEPDSGTIRINPALEQAFVPAYFVEYIVFHEMLHCLMEPRRTPSGRTMPHHSDFRRREREFHKYDEALKWQKKNLYRFMGKRGRLDR
jgi:hypothetical protein